MTDSTVPLDPKTRGCGHDACPPMVSTIGMIANRRPIQGHDRLGQCRPRPRRSAAHAPPNGATTTSPDHAGARASADDARKREQHDHALRSASVASTALCLVAAAAILRAHA